MRRIARKADQIITMCNGNIDDLIQTFPEINKSKCQCITNGFDTDDFGNLHSSSPRPSNKMLILHMGTLYAGTAGMFFHALAEMIHDHPEIKDDLEVNFIGYVPHSYQNLIVELGLSDTVHLLGFRNHIIALQSMLDSDLLLLLLGPQKITNQQFPGKVFEYLKAKRPILIVGRKGEVSDAILQCGSGILVQFDQTDKIKENLYRLYVAKMSYDLSISPDSDKIEFYDYRNLTERFSAVLEKARD